MGVLVNKNSKVIVQGFTGSEGSFHAGQTLLVVLLQEKVDQLIWTDQYSTLLQTLYPKQELMFLSFLFHRHSQQMRSWRQQMQELKLLFVSQKEFL
jgi:hypothetical protein